MPLNDNFQGPSVWVRSYIVAVTVRASLESSMEILF